MQSAIYPSLKGKRVVVTGGASGIGAAMVAGFARQGAETIFVDILDQDASDLIAALSDAAIVPKFHHVDLRDVSAVADFFRVAGPIDILLNNAASDDRHDLEEITPRGVAKLRASGADGLAGHEGGSQAEQSRYAA